MSRPGFHNARSNGASTLKASMLLASQTQLLSTLETKLNALTNDLSTLRQTNKHVHAVVYTQSPTALSTICSRVRSAGFQVYELSGKTKVTDRHEYIRKFQRKETTPKVFVLTIKAGSCGITLTAATRVYLMEPCIDPAHELQAAGARRQL